MKDTKRNLRDNEFFFGYIPVYRSSFNKRTEKESNIFVGARAIIMRRTTRTFFLSKEPRSFKTVLNVPAPSIPTIMFFSDKSEAIEYMSEVARKLMECGCLTSDPRIIKGLLSEEDHVDLTLTAVGKAVHAVLQ